MKGMFVCKHARQDIQPGICFLATQVWEPTEQDWAKLVRLMAYLCDTKSLMLHLIADGLAMFIGGLMHLLLCILTTRVILVQSCQWVKEQRAHFQPSKRSIHTAHLRQNWLVSTMYWPNFYGQLTS